MSDDVVKIEGESRFLVRSRSRKGNSHMVSFHRTDVDGFIEERCTCEDFLMGRRHLINTKQMEDTPENRRCWHIRKVNTVLADAAKNALVSEDPSQAHASTLTEQSRWPATRATS